jgi:S-DNA-T family DNA segregation ATPase FtsK/SpoIIIE
MVDPKMLELSVYEGIPHLLTPVVTDMKEAANALRWCVGEMERRYRLMASLGVRNVDDYNRKARRSKDKRPLSYIILIIDELADLMMTAAVDVERQLCRLGQMARATGIHLVLATQRPSVDVITGLIKANFPARIAFAVTTQIDSRVILDTPGAEKLLGRGDMLFMAPDSSKLQRIQGCFVSDSEIDTVVRFWKEQVAVDGRAPVQAAPWEGFFGLRDRAHDQLLDQALRLISHKATVSTSLLQRQLRIGFPRAARLMEQLEELGAVGPDEGGGRSREVLYRPESQSADGQDLASRAG